MIQTIFVVLTEEKLKDPMVEAHPYVLPSVLHYLFDAKQFTDRSGAMAMQLGSKLVHRWSTRRAAIDELRSKDVENLCSVIKYSQSLGSSADNLQNLRFLVNAAKEIQRVPKFKQVIQSLLGDKLP